MGRITRLMPTRFASIVAVAKNFKRSRDALAAAKDHQHWVEFKSGKREYGAQHDALVARLNDAKF